MNGLVCRVCARESGRLRFHPCPNHAIPVNPAECEHANARPMITANHAGNCPSRRCLDCGHFSACICQPVIAAYDAWLTARNGNAPGATVENLEIALTEARHQIEAAYK